MTDDMVWNLMIDFAEVFKNTPVGMEGTISYN